MAWKKVKVSKRMDNTDKILKYLTIGLGVFCIAVLVYGQVVLN